MINKKSNSSKKDPSRKLDPKAQIEKLLNQERQPQHIAIIAKDAIRRERALLKIAEHFQLKTADRWNYELKKIRLSQAKEQDLKNFIMESLALSFFSKKQIFLIEELDKLQEKQIDILEDLLKNSATSDRFFLYTGSSLHGNSRLRKYFEKQSSLIEMSDFDSRELRIWIKQNLSSRKLNAQPAVIEEIALRSEFSTDLAEQTINQLELFAEGEEVTLEMVEELFPTEFSAKEFAWLEALTSGNKLESLKLIEHAFSEGRESLQLTALLQSKYLNYFLIATLLKKRHTRAQIKEYLQEASYKNDWLFNKNLDTASRKTPENLVKDLKALVLADSKLKFKSLGKEAIFQELVNSLS